MSPIEIIERAIEDGVLLALSPSGSISARGVQSAIDRLLPAIRRSKAAIVLLLRPSADGWSAEDWQVFFDERAGVAEFDGGLPRPRAEASAYTCCVAEWLNRNPAYSPAGNCFGCGGTEHSYDPLQPFGIGSAGQVWLHSRCQPAWYAGRKAEAVGALAAMGIASLTNFPDDFGKNGRLMGGFG
jgi:hypothetical protein